MVDFSFFVNFLIIMSQLQNHVTMFVACNFLGPLSPIYTQCTCMLTSLNIKYTLYIHSIQIYFYPIGNVKILKNSTGFPRCPVVKTFS